MYMDRNEPATRTRNPELGTMGIVMRVITIVMMLVFVFGAAVQYNDPDPVG